MMSMIAQKREEVSSQKTEDWSADIPVRMNAQRSRVDTDKTRKNGSVQI
jgi:hypothetical protein